MKTAKKAILSIYKCKIKKSPENKGAKNLEPKSTRKRTD